MALSLQSQITRLRATQRILMRLARHRMEHGKEVTFLVEQCQDIEVTIKTLKYLAPYREQVLGKIQSIKEAEADVRVQAVLEAFPDAEITDVKDLEPAE